MEIKRLTREEIESIHNEFKAQLVDLCHEFNAKYLGHNSPYYPQAAYIQLSAVTEILDELKVQLHRTNMGRCRMEIKNSQQMSRCDRCAEMGINLNYIITPHGDLAPTHILLCSVCTAKHVNEFLNGKTE